MIPGRARLALLTALASLCLSAGCRAGEMKQVLDSAAPRSKLLTSHFATYGPPKSIYLEDSAVRFWFSPSTGEAGQAGLYSHFVLAGDFDVSAAYEWLNVPAPAKGYGISCGIALDADGKMLSLARAHRPDAGSGYVVTEGQLSGKAMEYKVVGELATSAKKGKLVLRREGAEVVCLAGEAEPFEEVCRVPFGTGTIRKVRLFGDPGGVPNRLDARLSNLVVRAEEITGNIPLRERQGGWGWWLAGGAAGGGLLVFRRLRNGSWFRSPHFTS